MTEPTPHTTPEPLTPEDRAAEDLGLGADAPPLNGPAADAATSTHRTTGLRPEAGPTDHTTPSAEDADPDTTATEPGDTTPAPATEAAVTTQAAGAEPEAGSTDHADPSAEDADPGTTPTDSDNAPASADDDVSDDGRTGDGVPSDGVLDDDVRAADDVPGEGVAADVVRGDDVLEDDGSAGDVLGDEDYLPPGQTEVPVGDEVVIDDDTMRRAIEAILMVTDEPLPVLTLARAVGRPTGDVAAALATLAEEYTEQGRGFDLREVGGGWRYYTRIEAAPYVERFVLDGQQARLTQAALETLAVVAYKQPVSRARVSAIRGVNVDGVVRTLVARGLVEEAGADTESQATLYRTTSYFLERMGMQSLDDLPELAPYLPDMDDIEDELAAQTLPPIPSAATDDDSGTPPPDRAAADESSTPAADEPAADEPTTAPDERPVADELNDPDTGIDGDLTTAESVDTEDELGDAEPADETEPASDVRTEPSVDEPADDAEPADEAGATPTDDVEPADEAGAVHAEGDAADESGTAPADGPAVDLMDDPDAGIDGDLTSTDPTDREADPDDPDPTPADHPERAGDRESADVGVRDGG